MQLRHAFMAAVLAAGVLGVVAMGAGAAGKGPLEKASEGVAEKGPLEKVSKAVEAAKVEPLVIRMYNVQDLTMGCDFPYRSSVVPPTSVGPLSEGAAYSEAAGGGGSASLFGGGAAAPGDTSSMASALTPDVIVELIKRTIAPDSWEDSGERGKIDRVGALLVVTQTAANQKKVEELLQEFRAARPMVAIEAKWVLIDDANVSKIVPEDGAKRTVPLEVTAAQLKEAGGTVIYRAQLTCFDRQTTHMASGRAQTLIADLQPVIAEAAVGWDAEVTAMLWGALIEVTPALSPDGKTVTLRVHSMISEGLDFRTKTIESAVSGGSEEKNAGGVAVAKSDVELPEFLIHTFRTTLRAPLDKGILIGGMTAPKAADGKVLYLFLQISASK